MPLAHPLTEPSTLPLSPLAAAFLAAGLVFVVALTWPRAEGRPPAAAMARAASWEGSLSISQVVARALALALLLLAVVAGRVGVDDELENLAPALVVGAAWPLLVLASAVLGPVWRWTDPWDGAARAFTRGRDDDVPEHVWPAVLVALPWVWYLSAYRDSLDPRSVGAILALYSLLTVAGCLALGRARWLGTSEPLGLMLSWTALLPLGRLTGWNPPRGAEALLGVLGGGVLFGAVRRSELWGDLNTVRGASLLAALGVVASGAAAAGLLLWLARRAERTGARGAVARAAVPAVAAIILAVAMDRNRLFTSIQLLPGLLGDPLGRGWDLLGRAGEDLDPAPLGTRGLLLAQLAVVLTGYLASAVVAARTVDRGTRAPVALGLAILAFWSVIALAAH